MPTSSALFFYLQKRTSLISKRGRRTPSKRYRAGSMGASGSSRQDKMRASNTKRRTKMKMAMTLLAVTVVFSLVTVVTGSHDDKPEVKDYCFPHGFNASCPGDKVILMHSAIYGRMRQIKCLTVPYHMNCQANVLGHVDRMCSGRHHCLVKIPDATLHAQSTCPQDMMAYLEASYSCVTVESGEGQNCRYPQGSVASPNGGYLASIVTETANFGSSRCPWVITLPQGQRINVTLLDFGVVTRGSESANVCHVYAKIKEAGLASEVRICGSATREKGVYISETNSAEIHVTNFHMKTDPIYFLLKYEAVGCVDPVIPQGSWYKRNGEKAAVYCNFTQQIWHIVCHGNRWVGEMDNCTIPTRIVHEDLHSEDVRKSHFPYGLLVAIITGILLGILIGVAMLAIVLFVHRRRLQRRTPQRPIYSPALDIQGSPFLDTQKTILPVSYGYTHMHDGVHSTGCPSGCPLHSPSVKSGMMTSQDAARPSSIKPVHSRYHTYEKPGYKREDGYPEVGPVYHEFDIQAIEGFQHDMDNKDNDNKYVPEPSNMTD